ncbi:MAG: hypothetical protein ACHQQR_00790 [Gemmatimonadales bacterium]
MGQKNFLFQPQVASTVLAAFSAIPDGSAPLTLYKDEVQQGLMGAMVNAEALAALKGFATPITVGTVQGVIIGGARDNAVKRGTGDRDAVLYLAQCQQVRRALAATTAAPVGATPVSYVTGVVFPILPVVIAIIVVAVAAAIVGVAWASVEKVRIESDAAKQVGLSDKVMQLATSGQSIDPKAYQALQTLATQELGETSGLPWWVWVGGGVAASVAAWVAVPKVLRALR